MGRLVSAYQLIQVIADLSFGNHAITSAWNNTESTPIGYMPINVKRAAVVQQEARSSRSSGSPPRSAECFIGIKGYQRPPEAPTSWVHDAQLPKWLEPSVLLSWPWQLPFSSVDQRGYAVRRQCHQAEQSLTHTFNNATPAITPFIHSLHRLHR